MTGVHYFLMGVFAYIVLTTVLSAMWFNGRTRLKAAERQRADAIAKYQPIIESEDGLAKVIAAANQEREALAILEHERKGKQAEVKRLSLEVSALEISADLADVGIHSLVFELDSHAAYVQALQNNQEEQKAMIRAKEAVIGAKGWTVNGKETEGRRMVDRAIRLALRAFNNECDFLMNRITWKNLSQIQDRIWKSAEAIDKLNESLTVIVSQPYIRLKLREAELRHQEAMKKQEERDELRRQREEEREEAQAQREYQAELRRQEKDERERVTAIVAAKAALSMASSAEEEALRARIIELESQLTEAQALRVRVQSMAELTRVGYVYVISNSGAFGRKMFKIGMTRRLEPMDRVRELGDASVPFPFDVHALVFTENAPMLERELHSALAESRVNRINLRKEFFSADIDHVRAVIHSRFPGIPFINEPDAQEYTMSLKLAERAAA